MSDRINKWDDGHEERARSRAGSQAGSRSGRSRSGSQYSGSQSGFRGGSSSQHGRSEYAGSTASSHITSISRNVPRSSSRHGGSVASSSMSRQSSSSTGSRESSATCMRAFADAKNGKAPVSIAPNSSNQVARIEGREYNSGSVAGSVSSYHSDSDRTARPISESGRAYSSSGSSSGRGKELVRSDNRSESGRSRAASESGRSRFGSVSGRSRAGSSSGREMAPSNSSSSPTLASATSGEIIDEAKKRGIDRPIEVNMHFHSTRIYDTGPVYYSTGYRASLRAAFYRGEIRCVYCDCYWPTCCC